MKEWTKEDYELLLKYLMGNDKSQDQDLKNKIQSTFNLD